MWSPKRAMILGAGMGQRMRPLTDNVPKPLVKLQEKPLIDHVLDRLHETAVKTIVVNVHYKAQKLENHLKKKQNGFKLKISDERDELLDTGGGVKKALPLLGKNPFFLHNSDSVWLEGAGSNLLRMASIWDDERMDCLMLLALSAKSIGYSGLGDFAMASDGRVRRRNENEIAPFVYTGVSIVHPRLLQNTPDGRFSMNLVWDRAIQSGRLFGMRHDGIWMHVGTPEALKLAERCMSGED